VIGPDGPRAVARGWHHGLDWGPAGIVAVRSGARTPSAVTVTDPDGARRVVARGPVGGFEASGLVEPEPVTWRGDDGLTVHGLRWLPTTSALGPGTRPPLLVDLHGGPTGQATAGWKPWVQYFVTRGWAVLAPNPRGSTGYGRAFAQALAGEWGHGDVADVAAGIRDAATGAWCDPGRVAVSGGSAGAMTVLLLCAHHPDLVNAGISMYGVTDLVALAETTHRFESRYTDRLVGVLPREADRYRERSPVTHAASIRVPLLVLQGDADRVVPPEQAQRLVDAVRHAGGTVDAHVYPGEGHGWSRPETVIDVYERADAFLRRTVLDR
jgi:dipeptidyl aminopeptidase/acylaminoacyl peptidase